MKKRVYLGFIISLCGGIMILLSCLIAPILLAELPAYELKNTTQIKIAIENYTVGKFTRVRYFDNAVYLIDSDGRKVIKHTDTADTIIHNTDSTDDKTKTQPYDIVSLGEKYFVSTTTLFVDLVDASTSTPSKQSLSSYKIENSEDDQAVLSQQTLTSSADGITYMIFGNNILYYNDSKNQLELFETLTYNEVQLSFEAGGGFCVTEDNSVIYFSIGTKIYKIDTETHEISEAGTSSSNITYLNTDNLGNIYYGNQNTIFKYNDDPANTTTASLPNNAISFDIDFVNGKIYYITNENEVFVTEIYANNENFVTNYSQIAPKVRLANIPASTTVISAVSTTKTARLYQFPSLLSPAVEYEISKRLILLDDSYSQFYYVFDNNSATSEGFSLGYILKTDCETVANEIASEFVDNKAGKVVTGVTKIFVMPISQAVATNTYVASLGQLNYGDTIGIIASPILPADSNGATFVAVKYTKNSTEYIGYIDSRTLVSSILVVADSKYVPNAKTNTETTIYSEKSCFNEVDVLAKGSSVKIISTLNGVSKIEYSVSEGETETIKAGYCKSENLDNGNLTTAQIIGLALMGVSVVITIIVLIILHKRKKKLDSLPTESEK